MAGPRGSCGCFRVTEGPTGSRRALLGSLTLFLSCAEPIQSRCAVLRYTKLTDAQILARLLCVIEQEKVPHTDDGLEAILFTAQGDMRQVRAPPLGRRPPGLAAPPVWGERGATAAWDECSQTGER